MAAGQTGGLDEGEYIAQFFSLEFFFRGFMLQPLRRQMGMSAILAVTVVPEGMTTCPKANTARSMSVVPARA